MAAERLEREVQQEPTKVKGTFRGLTLESGGFGLLTDDGLIEGSVADDLTEEKLLFSVSSSPIGSASRSFKRRQSARSAGPER